MIVTGWPHHGYYRGIAIKESDRDTTFERSWTSIIIETEDGQHLEAPITDSFWRTSSEFRYRQVGRWLRANGLARRANGNPPRFDLRQIGMTNHFKLTIINR
jgi:hypothetical protein